MKYGPAKICSFPECGRPHDAKGLCTSHYLQQKKGGELRPIRYQMIRLLKVCEFDECGRRHYSKGLCYAHYQQQKRGAELHPTSNIHTAITYVTAHMRCRRLWGPANQFLCIKCSRQADEWAYDFTDPTELRGTVQYSGMTTTEMAWSRFPEFYMPLCFSCHRQLDTRRDLR